MLVLLCPNGTNILDFGLYRFADAVLTELLISLALLTSTKIATTTVSSTAWIPHHALLLSATTILCLSCCLI